LHPKDHENRVGPGTGRYRAAKASARQILVEIPVMCFNFMVHNGLAQIAFPFFCSWHFEKLGALKPLFINQVTGVVAG
jgi:hypothetical protein